MIVYTKKEKEELKKDTSWLEGNVRNNLRAFCRDNRITSYDEMPKCCVCGKPAAWNHFKVSFGIFCSNKCRIIGMTNLEEKHRLEEYRNKNLEIIQKTNWLKEEEPLSLRRYCLSRNITSYGQFPKCPVCGKPIKWAMAKFKTFCSTECSSSEEGKKFQYKKIQESIQNKYGVDNISKLDTIKKRKEETLLQNYGVTNPSKNSDIQRKKVETSLKKYGVEFPNKNRGLREKIFITNKTSYFPTFLKKLELKKIEFLSTKEEFMESQPCTFKCLLCGNIFTSSGTNPIRIHCPDTSHKTTSKAEQEIYEWLSSVIKDDIIRNKRFSYENATLEADIYIPNKKIAIEYHGVYWHNELNTGKHKHQTKYLFFKSMGIKLIQIFENEWLHRRDIVKSIVENSLGVVPTRIYARKCSIQEIDVTTYNDFVSDNHIQGIRVASVRLGMFYNNTLVAVQSFSKIKKDSNNYEMIRYCVKTHTSIIGGFTRLLQKFILSHSPHRIVSFINLRYFSGDSYIKNGFSIKKEITCPNYFYFKKNSFPIELYSRNFFQKHKLHKKLDSFNQDSSEIDNMLNNGYLRIYDAGNMLMELDLEKS